jgi:hypothetical protein
VFLTVLTNLLDTAGLGQTSGATFRISSIGTTNIPNLPDLANLDVEMLEQWVLRDAYRSAQEDDRAGSIDWVRAAANASYR